MLRSKYLRRFIILLLFFHFCNVRNVFAHAGHDHSRDTTQITIERSTYAHLKSVLDVYREIYSNLINRELNDISVLAQRLLNAASKGVQTEPEGPGRYMMKHLLQGAESLKQAKDLRKIQEAFISINDAIIPFFKSWPNQLKHNKIKLYQCKEHGHCWLQPQDIPPTCPFSHTAHSHAATQARLCDPLLCTSCCDWHHVKMKRKATTTTNDLTESIIVFSSKKLLKINLISEHSI